jgi:ferritin-like metal-binding protein YciE
MVPAMPTRTEDPAASDKLLQYLNEAHATEHALARTLEAHIAVTPRGSYRNGLEKHLEETRRHAERVERRMGELGASRNVIQMGIGVVESLVGQALALSKGPFDIVRGNLSEEKLLKNAKDECATEALEIATYDALERFATSVGDEETARLAATIRKDEERMLESLRREIPKLTDAVVKAEVEGERTYDASTTGAADAARAGGAALRETARRATDRARSTARQARKVPGVAYAEGEAKGAVADEEDIPIANYDELNVNQVTAHLGELSQVDLAKVDAYERKHANRKSVLDKVNSLRGKEPWPGYDELSADEVREALARLDDKRVAEVRDYERRHKGRRGVLEAAEKERSKS